jgi:hypothetical protein
LEARAHGNCGRFNAVYVDCLSSIQLDAVFMSVFKQKHLEKLTDTASSYF